MKALLVVALGLSLVFGSCATVPVVAGKDADPTPARDLVWRCMGHDPKHWVPQIRLVTGPSLDCEPDQRGFKNGKQCVVGLTVSASMILLAHWGQPWSQTALTDELAHVHQMAYRHGAIDWRHVGEDYQPGGIWPRCQAALTASEGGERMMLGRRELPTAH